MSFSTSAYLSRSTYVVAIAGGTGNLGSIISKTILKQPYRIYFSRIILLVRNPATPISQELKGLGGELVQVDINDPIVLNKSLKGVDILINVLGTQDHHAKDKILDAVLANNILLYIPSEFGVDHRLNDFEQIEWERKKKHVARARREGGDKMKVVAVYAGLFLEDSIGPWFGFDTKNKHYTCIGSPETLVSFTSKGDMAQSIVQVVLQYFSSPSTLPDDIRIAGTTTSYNQIRQIMSRESNEDINLTSLGDPNAYKKELQERYGSGSNVAGYIRLIMGQGKLDFSKENLNELVNPEGKQWRWKSMEEYSKEVKGRPWIDTTTSFR
ncbi:isoflavone reductase family protein [Ramaria rubella]|nr:isoflavone reductase family protein [Ramaria rubella]